MDFDNDDPFVSNKKSDMFNADEKTQQFIDYILDEHENYRGNHLMVPSGCDFSHSNAK